MQEPANSGTSRQIPATAREIIGQSMSPFCPGLSLTACPSPSADSLRRDIVARVIAGESKQSILTHLENDFGTAILGAPKFSGSGAVAWVVPGVFLVVGALLITRWIGRRSKSVVIPTQEVLHDVETRSTVEEFTDEEYRRLERIVKED